MGVLFSSGATGGLSDSQLLQRFRARDGAPADAEAAFATLVERHGALVWGICRGITGDFHEAEDAFQATFVILARQAGSLWVEDTLGRWLRRVARRVATRARAEGLRRRAYPAPGHLATEFDPWLVAERKELRAAISDELSRLPEKYRVPVELCHLRGLKHDEAARLLDLPVGTVKSRLDRGKRRLRDTLARRGLAPGMAAATAAASAEAGAEVPVALVRRTLLAVVGMARGFATLPASVAALVKLSSGVALAIKLVIGLVAIVAGAVFAAWVPAVTGRGPSPAAMATAPAVVASHERGRGSSLDVSGSMTRATDTSWMPSLTPRGPGRPAASAPPGLATAHEEPEGPEPDLGAAILRELRNEPK
jgi:RNA polymerase sigma factor (sigma-70 family)